MFRRRLWSFVLVIILPTLFFLGSVRPSFAAMFSVTNTLMSGPGSLYDAIIQANSQSGSTIQFAISGVDGPPYIIYTTGFQITSSTLIDGTTQTGYSGTPLIEVRAITSSSHPYGF